MKYIMKMYFAFGILLCTTNIKSFDDLEHARTLFEEESALLALYNPDSVPALSDGEIGQFGLSLEPWDESLFETVQEEYPDLSTLPPSPLSEYIAPRSSYGDIFMPQYLEEEAHPTVTHIAIQEAASSVLRVQEKNHKKNFTCDYPGCGYATHRKADLTRHTCTHTGEKPYACNHPGCNYASTQKTNLKGHLRIHTGEKPYACNHPDCNYATAVKSNLKGHLRIHTGEKPYACNQPECSFRGALKAYLTKHMNKFHPQIPSSKDCARATPKDKKLRHKNKKQRRQ